MEKSLTTTGKVSEWNNDWSTRDDEFTRIIDSLPDNAVIVEIHGMKDSSLNEPVSVGTGDEPSESTDAIVGALQQEFDGHVSQDKFKAESGYTVTDYLQKKGHSVLQIELSRTLRDPKSNTCVFQGDWPIPAVIDETRSGWRRSSAASYVSTFWEALGANTDTRLLFLSCPCHGAHARWLSH